jgi:phosphoglucomutase
MALLSAEILAVTGKDPSQIYAEFEEEFGSPIYARIDSPCTPKDKEILKNLSPSNLNVTTLAGEEILETLTKASGNSADIGGLKVVAQNGWFAVRPSGTEDVYKIYAESFISHEHLKMIQKEAKEMLDGVFKA